MKLVLALIISISAFGGEILNNNDILAKKHMRLDLDGLELWDLSPSERQSATSAFTEKCLVEIPSRTTEHYRKLSSYNNFFTLHDIHGDYKVIKRFHSGYGTQLICRADIYTSKFANIYFKAEYTEIFVDKNGTLELCKDKVAKIDETASKDGIITRRAYFEYAKDSNGNVYFPRCQIAKVYVVDIRTQETR